MLGGRPTCPASGDQANGPSASIYLALMRALAWFMASQMHLRMLGGLLPSWNWPARPAAAACFPVLDLRSTGPTNLQRTDAALSTSEHRSTSTDRMQRKLDAFSSSKSSASSTHPQAPAQGRQGSRLVYLLTSKIKDKEGGEEGAVPGHDRPSIKRVREEEGVPTPTASVRGTAPSYLHLALQPVTSGAASRPRPANRRATKPPNPGGMLVLGGLPNVLAPQQKPFWQAEELTAQRRPVTLPAFNHYTDSLAHGVRGMYSWAAHTPR